MTKIKIAVQSWYGESKLQKVPQFFGCLLLFGVMFNSTSCNTNNGGAGGGGPIRPRVVLTTMPVTINDCEPEGGKDPIVVRKGKPVDWFAKDDNYVIHFESKYYPGTSTVIPVPSDLALPKGKTTSQPLSLPDDCTKKGCYFEYDIIDSTGKICNDPGVHVTPN